MCGICCFMHRNTTHNDILNYDQHCNFKSRLWNRGPDSTGKQAVNLSAEYTAEFTGHVLHLRGTEIAVQPAKDVHGNLLLWNGEIFNGIKVEDGVSDTQVLLDRLSSGTSDSDILHTFSQIQGPWAFIYLQESTHSLWFGRDVFGRRSLLWHLPRDETDTFVLSSVWLKPLDFSEIPSVGIFKMSLTDTSNMTYEFTLFPWQRAVWPGTLDPVTESEDFTERLTSGQSSLPLTGFKLDTKHTVSSQMPVLNKTLPEPNYTLPQLAPEQNHIEYLQALLQTHDFLKRLSEQLEAVLLQAVKTRVHNQPKQKLQRKQVNEEESQNTSVADPTLSSTDQLPDGASNHPECISDTTITSSARVAILFSGGIDSTVIAALADKCVPEDEPIDLMNVAFELREKAPPQPKKKKPVKVGDSEKWNVPDRLTGYTALAELNPRRQWNFIEVNVTADQLQHARQEHIQELVYPLQTVLDDSIGCAVWFAARGHGVLGNGDKKGTSIVSDARVVLCGMGADEQLVGYSRHRNKFKEGGWTGLMEEIELEVTRISTRNLGRDDRIITDHGKESRFPFLDERVVQFLSSLPLHHKANLELPRGIGEKLLLRLVAINLGLHKTAILAKRAIQFGSRIAKLENSKEKATDICDRLSNVTT